MNLNFTSITGTIIANLEYVLLVISMMMTRMLWLRLVAIGSGVAGIVYALFWLHDPVGEWSASPRGCPALPTASSG